MHKQSNCYWLTVKEPLKSAYRFKNNILSLIVENIKEFNCNA